MKKEGGLGLVGFSVGLWKNKNKKKTKYKSNARVILAHWNL